MNLLIYLLFKLGGFLFGVMITYLVIIYVWNSIDYRRGAYYRCTGRSRTQLSSRRGTRGEYETYEALRKLEKMGWKFLFELYIPKESGGTTEIDSVAIGPQGVFCIESKDYSGEIYGNEDAKNWVQVKPHLKDPNERTMKFYNPLMQNAGHVANLEKLLAAKFHRITYYSLVVFSDRCKLYVPRASQYLTEICQTKHALATFNRMRENGNELDADEVLAIYTELKQYTRASNSVKARHRLDCFIRNKHN